MRLGVFLQTMGLMFSQNVFENEPTSVRIISLLTTILTLAIAGASVIQVLEAIPWHNAFYFTITLFSTVGFGDIAPVTMAGRFSVIGLIFIGAVTIPIQTSRLASLLNTKPAVLGSLPGCRFPIALVCSRLTNLDTFVDFFTAFFHEAFAATMPSNFRLVCLTNRPTYEFRAYQAANDRRLTLVQGSPLSDHDLARTQAGVALTHLLLADRFSADPITEDLSMLFQVWARVLGYTKDPLTPL
jgi:hypothetical protein